MARAIVLAPLLVVAVACDGGGSGRDASPSDGPGRLPWDATLAGDAGPEPSDDAAALEDSGGGAQDARADGGSGPGDDASGPLDAAGPGTGACASRACRDRIASDADFLAIARPSTDGACQFDRELWFITPRSAASPIQDTFYVDANARPQLIDFVRGDLGGRYAALDVEQFFRTFERADLREYWSGRIRRLTPVAGQPVRYGLDLSGWEYWGTEPLTAAELQGLIDQLGRTFALPLGYAPGTASSIRSAEGLTSPTFPVHLPILCPGEVCPAGGPGPCVIIPENVELCGHFIDNRNIQEERANQLRVQLAPGAHRLTPQSTPSLIASGEHGPQRTPVVVGRAGRVVTQDVGGTTYWSIEQAVTVGGAAVELRLDIPSGSAPLVMRDPFLDRTTIYGVIGAGTPAETGLRLTSCAATDMPRYYAEADLGGGDRVRLEYRHQVPFAGSGPLVPTRADVVLGGTAVTVEDYFGLVYAGVHHNWDNQFWIFFGRPISFQGHDVHGLWIDEPGTRCCPVDSIRTIDASGRPLDTLSGNNYLRAPSIF